MQNVLNVEKPIGMTPYQVVQKIKADKNIKRKIGYAGRLDPMAHGVLILLIEPETKKRKRYQNMDKEYVFEILFGVATDTYDLLGKIVKIKKVNSFDKESFAKNLKKLMKEIPCKFVQKYPPYSSARVNGKPLFYWARKDLIQKIKVPRKKVEIYDIQFRETFVLSKEKLVSKYLTRIDKVKGDFRQKEIKKDWQKFLKEEGQKFLAAQINIHCSSGTYVRSIANEIGKNLGVPAIALDIKRTKVGKFRLQDSIKIRHKN